MGDKSLPKELSPPESHSDSLNSTTKMEFLDHSQTIICSPSSKILLGEWEKMLNNRLMAVSSKNYYNTFQVKSMAFLSANSTLRARMTATILCWERRIERSWTWKSNIHHLIPKSNKLNKKYLNFKPKSSDYAHPSTNSRT